MGAHLYISAADADAPLVAQLRQQLQQAGFVVWDGRGSSSAQVPQAIQACWALLVVASPHSINATERHSEWTMALRSDKPLVPLVIGAVTLPSLLQRRRPLTASDPNRIDMPALLQRLTWLRSPRGEMQALRDRLGDLERSLARGQTSNADAIRAEIDRVQRQISAREQGLAAPVPQPAAPAPAPVTPAPAPIEPAPLPFLPQLAVQRHEDWGEAPDVHTFYGRQDELATLAQWITADRCRLVSLLGIGGMGKTTLATKVARTHADDFAYVVWRSLRNAPPLNDLLGQCIVFLSDQRETDLPDDSGQRISILIRYLQQQRCLLILDNAETILRGGDKAGRYREGYEGYGDLILRVGEAQHQSLLIITSREKPREFARLEGTASPVRSLQLAGVGQDDGKAILYDKGLEGSDHDWAELVRIYSGNPLALKLTAESIREIFAGEIAGFLSEGGVLLGDVLQILAQQFDRLAPLEQELMYWLAIEREPVTADELRTSLVAPVGKRDFLEALGDLRRRSLVEQSPAGLTLQNVVMEYVTDRLVEQVTEEILNGTIKMLNTHALMKAQAKEYVRNSQVRLILAEVLTRLEQRLGSKAAVTSRLTQVLAQLRAEAAQEASQ
ncbi:MAG: TIR domain-containing protein [Oscillochloris sp.]|nr:TIR domain-containing protein [Oscillochloris sp.]